MAMDRQKKMLTDNVPLKSSLVHNPFGCLKGLVEPKHLPQFAPEQKESPVEQNTVCQFQSEEDLFFEAMAGVNPITKERITGNNVGIKLINKSRYTFENDALSQLTRLVNRGEGFIVSDTPEYMEGTGYNVPRQFARRLHQGDFSIQAHIDLHGLNAESAKEAFELFMRQSIRSGKRAVIIIHGRGLSSPGEAILKNKVREWLNQSYWLKRVIAYASAQLYDGGAGATYVLLRNRPVSKRSPKAKSGR
jgi:DNA-nicking Smr family endonuclease